MSALAATTVAALLIASPSMTDADRIAANGGFLVGNAQRCGMRHERVKAEGELVRALIAAAAGDDRAEKEATVRYTMFFLVSVAADPKTERPLASCPAVAAELARLERHGRDVIAFDDDGKPLPFGPGDGE